MADASNSDSVEIWKPIPGWEGLYSVSSLGNVRSEPKTIDVLTRWGHRSPRHWPSKLISQQPCMGSHMGYLQVHLKSNGRREAHYVHRLVCRAFHGEPPSQKHQVAHSDGKHLNNKASNVRWATPQENLADKVSHGTIPKGDQHKCSLLTEAAVREIRAVNDRSKDSEFATRFGTAVQTIAFARLGHTWKHVEVGK
ncbi:MULTISPECIES: NUMOD4 domain-containing protein [unclassified Sphingopyxis]